MPVQARELRELGTHELEARLDSSREELRNLRFQRAVGQLTDFTRLTAVRRDIARLATILREREIASAPAASESAASEEE